MKENWELLNALLSITVPLSDLSLDDGWSERERALLCEAWDTIKRAQASLEVRTGAFHDWWQKYMPHAPLPDHVPKRPVPHE